MFSDGGGEIVDGQDGGDALYLHAVTRSHPAMRVQTYLDLAVRWCFGATSFTAETATRLERHVGTSEEFWMNLHHDYLHHDYELRRVIPV